jgi:anti-sigma factor RsiW
MSETFACLDPGALVAYLYDECAAEERETIAAHLSRCIACANEVNALRSTRQALAAWAPPEIDLGLQITRKGEAARELARGDVLPFTRPRDEQTERVTPWWKAPLPGWAQVAAAVLIFAAGLSVGWIRPEARPAPPAQTAVQPTAPAVVAPSKEELAQLEQRLRGEMAQLVRASATTAPAPTPVTARSDDAIMQRVQELLEQSEARQRVEFTERLVRQAGTIEAQRRADLESFGRSVGQINAVVRQHREAIDENNRMLVRVSQSR